ncbi:hypothetical protein TrCOL_g2603 [Triparma columacea]|uniref:J domain-containing protein n=1 Tax=Triparma columacea TaxID=722753 RepID=A0A9W7GG88_9STRA|nr:hypothetical protein TrCOL_g2603 [Triparma columacea]
MSQPPQFIDHYEILGIPVLSPPSVVSKAYKKLSLKYHPDKQRGKSDEQRKVAEDMFMKVKSSYEVLKDEKLKLAYDETILKEKRKAERELERRDNMGKKRKGMLDELNKREQEAMRGKKGWMGEEGRRKEAEREAEAMRGNLDRVREREKREREERKAKKERKEDDKVKKVSFKWKKAYKSNVTEAWIRDVVEGKGGRVGKIKWEDNGVEAKVWVEGGDETRRGIVERFKDDVNVRAAWKGGEEKAGREGWGKGGGGEGGIKDGRDRESLEDMERRRRKERERIIREMEGGGVEEGEESEESEKEGEEVWGKGMEGEGGWEDRLRRREEEVFKRVNEMKA